MKSLSALNTYHRTMRQVDVGFGPNGPTKPLLLENGTSAVSISPAEMRLVEDKISPNADSNQAVWIFQTRSDPEKGWVSAYCFYDIEFLPEDF